ncbi:MAG: hypothetical protein PHP42_05755, partial [Bacteroidota bacterium]|nr:hypothetical protein [Bacteroidota bacterium]
MRFKSMVEFSQKIFESELFQKLNACNVTPDQPMLLRGISGSLWAFAAVALFRQANGQVLVVVDDKDRAEKLRDDCISIIGDANVRLCIVEPHHVSQSMDMSSPLSQIETLKALQANTPAIYITHATALAFGVPDQKEFSHSIIELSAQTEHPFEQLLQKLSEYGFERKQFVETYGDIAVRGGILDVFPFIGEYPIRVEFWGDTIESIREFDVLSQRSIRELQSVSIIPDVFKKTIPENETEEPQKKKVSLLSYFASSATLLLEDSSLLKKEFDEFDSEGVQTDFLFDDVKNESEKFSRFSHSLLQHADV